MEKNQNSVFMPHRTTAMFIDVFVDAYTRVRRISRMLRNLQLKYS